MDTILPLFAGLVIGVLGTILSKLVERHMDKKKENTLFIADIEHVVEWKWSGTKLLRHLIALDYETTENLNEGNEGTPAQWAPVFMENTDCWKLLALRECELVGYWSFFSLEEEFFKKVLQGEVSDSEITLEKVKPFEHEGDYNLYIVMICIKDHYRYKGFKLLLNSMLEQLNALTKKGIHLKEICVNAFSEEGKLLSKNFGLVPSNYHKEYGQMYVGTYEDMKKSKLGRGKLI